MAFRTSTYSIGRFNSAASSEMLTFYQDFVVQRAVEESKQKPSERFAPSSFRCDRLSWFRIRGSEPDGRTMADPLLQFKADMGTACHRLIQTNLAQALGDDWLDVEQYLKDHPVPWEYKITKEGTEWKVEIVDPPFGLACDGIIRWNGKIYLLEIKTLDYGPHEELVEPLEYHVDQVMCYATLLGLDSVLFLYQDRTYGGLKSYEIFVKDETKASILARATNIMKLKEMNVAPPKLPTGDKACTYCDYKEKCKQW